MNFEDWWMQLHPAEVDELKPVFEDCWKQAKREQMDKVIARYSGAYFINAYDVLHELNSMAEELK